MLISQMDALIVDIPAPIENAGLFLEVGSGFYPRRTSLPGGVVVPGWEHQKHSWCSLGIPVARRPLHLLVCEASWKDTKVWWSPDTELLWYRKMWNHLP